MNDLKNKKFLEGMMPILSELNEKWFPADEKTPDGKHYYACSYCDLNCGQHDKHDNDCYYQRAKNTIDKLKELDESDHWDLTHNGMPREEKQIFYFKNQMKYRAVFELFIQNASDFLPMDYSDPANKSIVCQCHMMSSNGKNGHDENCVNVLVSKVLREYFSPTGRRPKSLRNLERL